MLHFFFLTNSSINFKFEMGTFVQSFQNNLKFGFLKLQSVWIQKCTMYIQMYTMVQNCVGPRFVTFSLLALDFYIVPADLLICV